MNIEEHVEAQPRLKDAIVALGVCVVDYVTKQRERKDRCENVISQACKAA